MTVKISKTIYQVIEVSVMTNGKFALTLQKANTQKTLCQGSSGDWTLWSGWGMNGRGLPKLVKPEFSELLETAATN